MSEVTSRTYCAGCSSELWKSEESVPAPTAGWVAVTLSNPTHVEKGDILCAYCAECRYTSDDFNYQQGAYNALVELRDSWEKFFSDRELELLKECLTSLSKRKEEN